jgi:hypothetical protein
MKPMTSYRYFTRLKKDASHGKGRSKSKTHKKLKRSENIES